MRFPCYNFLILGYLDKLAGRGLPASCGRPDERAGAQWGNNDEKGCTERELQRLTEALRTIFEDVSTVELPPESADHCRTTPCR